MTAPVDTPDEGPEAIKLTDTLTVMMKQPTEDQIAIIVKSVRAAERNPATGAIAIDIVFRVITNLLVDPADSDRIDTALIDEGLKIRDLASKALRFEVEDAKPAAPRRARRR